MQLVQNENNPDAKSFNQNYKNIMPSVEQMQYLEELINKQQADESKQNEKKSDFTVKTNKKIVVSKAFINKI